MKDPFYFCLNSQEWSFKNCPWETDQVCWVPNGQGCLFYSPATLFLVSPFHSLPCQNIKTITGKISLSFIKYQDHHTRCFRDAVLLTSNDLNHWDWSKKSKSHQRYKYFLIICSPFTFHRAVQIWHKKEFFKITDLSIVSFVVAMDAVFGSTRMLTAWLLTLTWLTYPKTAELLETLVFKCTGRHKGPYRIQR